jgi:hypothetical protein
MGNRMRGKLVLAILLLLFSAFASCAEEKEKKFEVLFAGGSSYATSRNVFSLAAGFSYHVRSNLALSFDIGLAYHVPYLDLLEYLKIEEGQYHTISVDNQYRLFSSFSAEYLFDVYPRLKPFLTAGVGWCGDYVDFSAYGFQLKQDGAITCSEYGRCEYRKSGFPLILVGGGVRYYIGDRAVLKVTGRGLGFGSDFVTYQVIVSWGFRF